MPLGNVYYYFKTKEDLIGAAVQAHADQLGSGVAALEQRHRTPRARLKALVRVLAGHRDLIAKYGCPYGTLSSELSKRAGGSDPLAAPLMQIPLDWAEQQFRAMGRRDSRDLAAELIAAYQGAAVLSSSLGRPEVMGRLARRLDKWIDTFEHMNRDDVLNLCARLPGAVEDYPFGDEVAVFKVGGRMFALVALHGSPGFVNLKCDPTLALELRALHPSIRPGYHANKRHWNTVELDGTVDDSTLRKMIQHSYELVVSRLPAAQRHRLPGSRPQAT